VWLRIFEALAAKSPQSLQLIDSSIIRAPTSMRRDGKKGSRITPSAVLVGGLSTKINAVVDHCGCCRFGAVLSQRFRPSGQGGGAGLARRIAARSRRPSADRGYDAGAIIDLVRDHGGRPHIPTQRDRKVQRSVDPQLYRQRNLDRGASSTRSRHFRRTRNALTTRPLETSSLPS